MPVAVAIMTPVLPMLLFFGQKIAARISPKKKEEVRKEALMEKMEESSTSSSSHTENSFIEVGFGDCVQAPSIYPS